MKPPIKHSRRALVGALLLASLNTLALAAPVAAPSMSEHLNVTGLVKTPLHLSVEDVRAMSSAAGVGNVPLVCESGADKGVLKQIRGIPLKTLLDKAQLDTRHPLDARRMFVVAKGTDGYRVVYSWGELFNSPEGDQVLVYVEREGKPLGADEGRFALVPMHDLRTGARQVKWLERIDVRRIDE